MATIRDTCPLCGGALTLISLECQQCHTHLEGPVTAFEVPTPPPARAEADLARFGALGKLSTEQLAFVETFLRARGIIKTVEAMLGISYPTVRNRLDDVIATMGLSPADEPIAGEARREQREILADLAEGRISTEQAHNLLRRMVQGDTPSANGASRANES